ncbi:amino acid adenylation domain-containing protein [Bacillus pseudomycoides]|uniref:amino acid adenylation domain-containing protein n=1 Tax=Bacillus pseudomycoides TaxID=64104 RepID=UPI003D1EEF42
MSLDKYTENIILSSSKYSSEKEYWTNYLKDCTFSSFPADNQNVLSYESSQLSVIFTDDLSRRIDSIVKGSKQGIFMLGLAAINIVLDRYISDDDVLIGTPVFSASIDAERRINDILLIKSKIKPNMKIMELLHDLQGNLYSADKHQNYPLVSLCKSLCNEEDFDGNEFYLRNMVCMEGVHDIEIIEGIKSDTIFRFSKRGSVIHLTIKYNALRYEKETIEKIVNHIINILILITQNPNQQLNSFDFLTKFEKELVLRSNTELSDYPINETIIDCFIDRVKQFPNNIAVTYEDKDLTYLELNSRVNLLAYKLRERGVKPGTIVGLFLDRSIDMIVGILATLKAGGAYLPMDVEYPKERLNFLAKDSNADILISNKDNLEWFLGDVLNLETLNWNMSDDVEEIKIINKPNDLAYVIYTSGTTGIPKGVMIEHRNVMSLIKNNLSPYNFSSSDVWTLFHSYSFDFSVWELFGALLFGGQLIIVPKEVTKDPGLFLELLRDKKVTILNQTPSYFQVLSEAERHRNDRNLQIKTIIFGGEALQPGKLRSWHEKYPSVQFVNMYGLTEATVHVTFKKIEYSDIESNLSIIGVPIPSLRTYLLDKYLRAVPPGVVGELYVGGHGVCRGYLNRPELNKERFITNPYRDSERLYKTGDLGRILNTGELVYVGRKDQQVKVRGHRIELGEIEATLLKNSAINQIVVVSNYINEQVALCAYYVSDTSLSQKELRDFANTYLPEFMVPAYFVKLSEIPLTSNGKLDKDRLPDPLKHISNENNKKEPQTEEQKVMLKLWEEVLRVSGIGISDNFYELGGDSIKAIQIISRLNELGMKTKVKDILDNPTIELLSPLVDKNELVINQKPIKENAILTPIQKWLYEYPQELIHHYNQCVVLYRKEGYDKRVIEDVFSHIIKHHDALRMAFPVLDGETRAVFRGIDEKLFNISSFNFQDLENPEKKIESEIIRLQKEFNILKGPMVNIGLFKTSNGDHLFIGIHHLVVDAYSWRIILEDFTEGYKKAIQKNEIAFPLKTNSYLEWANKLKSYSNNSDLKNQYETYWKCIKQINTGTFPVDVQVSGEGTISDLNTVSVKFSKQETEMSLRAINKAFKANVNELLLTSLGLALKKWCGQSDFVIDLESHGREEIFTDINMARTVGWFTSIYPFHLDMSHSNNMSYQMKAIKESIRKVPEQGIGFGVLKYMRNENIEKNWDGNSEILYNYLGELDNNLDEGFIHFSSIPGLGIKHPLLPLRHSIEINAWMVQKCLTLELSYDKRRFKAKSIERLNQLFRESLKDITELCLKKGEYDPSPSDFTYKGLSIKQLEKINLSIKKNNK